MAKTILIPTDLQIGSLNTLKACLSQRDGEGVRVILMYAVHAPDGISDLLFYSPKRSLNARMTPPFKQALAVLMNRFAQELSSMEIVPFHGITQTAFDHFAKAHGVKEIHVSPSYALNLHDRAMDPLPFIRNARIRLVEHGQAEVPGKASVRPAIDNLQLLFER